MSLDHNADKRLSFPGLKTIRERQEAVDHDAMAAEILQADARLSAILGRLKSIYAPYVDVLKDAMENGDSVELASQPARLLRAGGYYLGRGLTKIGLPMLDVLDPEKKINWHAVSWVDDIKFTHGINRVEEFHLRSAVYFQKGGDTGDPKVLRAYTVDITQPGSDSTASLLLRIDREEGSEEDQVSSQKLVASDNFRWMYSLDRLAAFRLGGEDFNSQKGNGRTSIGEFMQVAQWSDGASYYHLSKGSLETFLTGVPKLHIEGEVGFRGSKTVKVNKNYEFNKKTGFLSTDTQPGEKPKKFYWSASTKTCLSNSHNIAEPDFLNFQRATLLLIPSTVPDETKKALIVD